MFQTYSTMNIFSAFTATVAASRLGSNFPILNWKKKFNFCSQLKFFERKNSENKILNELKLVIPNAASWMATFIKCHFSIAFNAVYLQLDRLLIGDKKL